MVHNHNKCHSDPRRTDAMAITFLPVVTQDVLNLSWMNVTTTMFMLFSAIVFVGITHSILLWS